MKKRLIENLSNRTVYSLIAVLIVVIVGVGVYAYGTSNPSSFGHSAGELNVDINEDGIMDKTLQQAIDDGDIGDEINSLNLNNNFAIREETNNLVIRDLTDSGHWAMAYNRDSNRVRLSNGVVDIRENGRVGIGVSNPSQTLDISTGDGNANNNEHQFHAFEFRSGSSGQSFYGGVNAQNNYAYIQSANIGVRPERLYINHRGGRVIFGENVYADAYYYNSDGSLKENIKSLDSEIENIMKLNPVKFDWKENGNPDIGFVAQEVEDIYPEFVSENDGKKSVQYGKLTAVLTKALQEQQKKIEELESEIEELKN